MPGKNGHFSLAAILPSVTVLQDLSSLMEAITLSNNMDCYQPSGLLYPMIQSVFHMPEEETNKSLQIVM